MFSATLPWLLFFNTAQGTVCVCVCVCVCVFERERERVCVCSQHTHTHTHKQVSRIHESLEKVAYMDARVDELDNKINHVIQV